ncbi:lipase class 3 family protein [Lactarius hengduanensis]|nr:lipase class 3 family protein [Lactarius hengduanensis]
MLSWLTIVVASVDLAPAAAFKRQSISPLSPDQILQLCGVHPLCPRDAFLSSSALRGKSLWSRRDRDPVLYVRCPPNWSYDTAIVVHQGTNVTHILILTDLKVTLDSDLFPRRPVLVPSSTKVHSRFSKDRARTTPMVLSAVQDVTSKYNVTSVPTVGDSLGAAPSLLDSVHLRLQLPADISVKAILYGLPRVGNQDWASFVDTHLRFIGYYHHPSGEIHIDDADAWDVCPGQDNPSKMCVVGAVPSLFHSNWWDHDGPYYDGIVFSCTTPLLTADS